MIRLALIEPDIPQNTGTLMRLCSVLGVPLEIVEPCGFLLDDKRLRRAGMDYLDALDWRRHRDADHFNAAIPGRRIALEPDLGTALPDFEFQPDDCLLAGAESSGLPGWATQNAVFVHIPQRAGARSLNVAVASAIVLAEALRQCRQWPMNGQIAASGSIR